MNPLFSTYTDAELWQAFKANEEEAYACIYHRYASELYNYGRHLVKNRQLVEDCIHDLFVYLYEHRHTLGSTDSIKFYLFRSLRRKISESVDAQMKYADELDALGYDFEVVYSPETKLIEELSAQVLQSQILDAINQLPKRQREALYLLYYNGLSYQEVAAIMSLKVRTLYNQVHTALQTLKKVLEKASFTGPILVLFSFLFSR
jgi:RNA polymerase sigma factor (sigma-70 family)